MNSVPLFTFTFPIYREVFKENVPKSAALNSFLVLQVSILDAQYIPVDVTVTDNKDGTYTCTYVATRNVKHTVSVTYGGVCVPNAPFRVLSQFSLHPQS